LKWRVHSRWRRLQLLLEALDLLGNDAVFFLFGFGLSDGFQELKKLFGQIDSTSRHGEKRSIEVMII
jgi:hypothetical protein